MKAQKVYENIDFERGGDPLDKLGVGSFQQRVLNKIKSLVKSQWPDAQFLDEEVRVKLNYYDTFFLKISLKVAIDDINAGNSLDRPAALSVFGEDLDYEMDKLGLDLWDLSQEKKRFWQRNKKDILNIEVLNKDAAIIYVNSPEDLGTPQKRPEGLIEESIDFERGTDPKTSMDLGLKANIIKSLKKIIRDGELTGVAYVDDKTPWGKVYSPQLLFRGPGTGFKDMIKRYLKDYGLLKYFDGIISYHKHDDNFLYYKLNPEFSDLFKDIELHWRTMNEAVEFERGIDPKEKLKIGDWHKEKIRRELKKVTDYFNEPWMEAIFPELVKEIDDLGIELDYLLPDYFKFPYDYTGKPMVEMKWKTSEGKEIIDSVDISKHPDVHGNFTPKNNGNNVLKGVIDNIKWYEHNLMK